jgi:adenylate cyclase
MDNQETASSVRGNAIMEWLTDESLHDSEPAAVYSELCLRLRDAGIPILRGQVGFRILHPLYDASTIRWTVERGVVVDHFGPEDSVQERFLRSPLSHVLTHRLPVFRRRLTGPAAILDFAVLEEFRAIGGTDYVVFLVSFDRAGEKGIICSWIGNRTAGFTDDDITLLQRIVRQLGVALKSKIEHYVAQNIARAYLGKD